MTTDKEAERERARILIVDDEESIRWSLQKILSNAGYEVSVVQDGQAAVALSQQADFEVAFVDRILSNSMNGIEVIREIKKINSLCETVLMSAYPSFESAAQLMEHETFAYLTKPILQDEICRVAHEAARKSRGKRENERAESVFKEVFDASPNPIIVYDPDFNITFVNAAFTKFLGYDRDQVLGQSLMLVPEDDVPLVMGEFQSLINGSMVNEREQVMVRSDGALLDTNRIVSMCSCRGMRGSDILVIIRDVSVEKKMQAQIVQSEKLAMLGELSAKLAHEINNPLQIISGQVEMLLLRGGGAEIAQELGSITEAARKIQSLTTSLMFVATPKPLKNTCIAPENLIEKAAAFLFSMGLIKHISILRDYTCCGELVEGDENQLEQVLMNLITNAVHAMDGAHVRTITLRTSADHERSQVHISVSDTGCGIDDRNLDKIFEPFFTTKENGKGNGLGLSVVKQIIKQHSGSIAVVSESGTGTTFTISLPMKQMHAAVVLEKSV